MRTNKGVISLKKKLMAASLFLGWAAVFLILGIAAVEAQGPNLGIDYVAPLNLANNDPRIAVVELVRLVITFIGIIAVVFVIYAGFLWMTSAGNEEKVGRAKKTLVNAVIGLAIILSAFLIVSFIISRLNDSLTPGGGPGAGGGPGGIRGGLGASGNSVIESHYPVRNQENVARNTKIVITFKEPMLVGDLITGGNINSTNVLIYKTNDPTMTLVTTLVGASTPDLKTFSFTQVAPYIGSPSENINYTVELTSAIRKANNDLAWPGAGGGYLWRFTTGTFIDTTPPRVVSIIPEPAATEPRNVIIQINFNEAIDPVAASGPSAGMPNIVVSDGVPVVGNFYISNEYRTVEYLTESACGTNSCGQTVYCLPGLANISVLVRAATLLESTSPAAVYLAATPPYDGIIDMANNSLDGNKNGTAQGPQVPAMGGFGSSQPPYSENSPDAAVQGDDYTWSFATNNTIDISAPAILSRNPSGTSVGVAIAPEATFSKILMSRSLTKNDPPGTGSVGLGTPTAADEVFYWLRSSNSGGQTTAYISHEAFLAGASYTPEYNSNILDKYQNCYNPAAGFDCTPTTALPYCCDGAAQAGSCMP